MPVSRSTEESHLYMQLHPCDCGEADFEWRHRQHELAECGLVARYRGECGRCGRERRFAFALAPEPSPPPPAFGGRRPSQIIDPGDFLRVSRLAAATVAADPTQLSDDEFHPARDSLAVAVAALDEVLKFIPDRADAVPAEAFRSEAGQREYRADPQQFTRSRLGAVRDGYRRLLARYDAGSASEAASWRQRSITR